jgi:hypothetical protein
MNKRQVPSARTESSLIDTFAFITPLKFIGVIFGVKRRFSGEINIYIFFTVSHKRLMPQGLHVFCVNLAALGVCICDHGRVRTCNPQSRNLIFYPVELRSQLILDCRLYIQNLQSITFSFKSIISSQG